MQKPTQGKRGVAPKPKKKKEFVVRNTGSAFGAAFAKAFGESRPEFAEEKPAENNKKAGVKGIAVVSMTKRKWHRSLE